MMIDFIMLVVGLDMIDVVVGLWEGDVVVVLCCVCDKVLLLI